MIAKPASESAPAASLQLFDEPVLNDVDGDSKRATRGAKKPRQALNDKTAGKTGSTYRTEAPKAKQAYLPGLSRRGRPRLANPLTAVQRTAEHRKKRLEQGARRVEMILAPDVASALDALAAHYQEPRSDVVAGLILKAAARVLRHGRDIQPTVSA